MCLPDEGCLGFHGGGSDDPASDVRVILDLQTGVEDKEDDGREKADPKRHSYAYQRHSRTVQRFQPTQHDHVNQVKKERYR